MDSTDENTAHNETASLGLEDVELHLALGLENLEDFAVDCVAIVKGMTEQMRKYQTILKLPCSPSRLLSERTSIANNAIGALDTEIAVLVNVLANLIDSTKRVCQEHPTSQQDSEAEGSSDTNITNQDSGCHAQVNQDGAVESSGFNKHQLQEVKTILQQALRDAPSRAIPEAMAEVINERVAQAVKDILPRLFESHPQLDMQHTSPTGKVQKRIAEDEARAESHSKRLKMGTGWTWVKVPAATESLLGDIEQHLSPEIIKLIADQDVENPHHRQISTNMNFSQRRLCWMSQVHPADGWNYFEDALDMEAQISSPMVIRESTYTRMVRAHWTNTMDECDMCKFRRSRGEETRCFYFYGSCVMVYCRQ